MKSSRSRPPKLNSVEPPRYGSVCQVIWEGRGREASPYPDLTSTPAVRRLRPSAAQRRCDGVDDDKRTIWSSGVRASAREAPRGGRFSVQTRCGRRPDRAWRIGHRSTSFCVPGPDGVNYDKRTNVAVMLQSSDCRAEARRGKTRPAQRSCHLTADLCRFTLRSPSRGAACACVCPTAVWV